MKIKKNILPLLILTGIIFAISIYSQQFIVTILSLLILLWGSYFSRRGKLRSELLILMDFTTVISNTQVDIKSYVIELKNIGSGRAQNLKGEVMYYFEKENPVQEKIHALDDIGTIFPDKAEVISVSYPFDCHSITKISCIIHYEDGGGSWQSKRDYKVVTPYKNEKKLLVTQKRGAFTMCDANEYYFESLTKTIYDKIEIRRFKWRNIKK